MLDAKLPPQDKIEIAPDLFGGLNTDDPRGELRKSIAKARAGLDGEEATELGHLGDRLDDVVTGAVRSAFRPTFIVTAALALLAALILLSGAGRAAVDAGPPRGRDRRDRRARSRPPDTASPIANSTRETVQIGDPCQDRELPDVGGISGALQDISLAALDRAACKFGSSREELLLALFDDRLQHKFEEEHGVNPRDALSLGPALLGF